MIDFLAELTEPSFPLTCARFSLPVSRSFSPSLWGLALQGSAALEPNRVPPSSPGRRSPGRSQKSQTGTPSSSGGPLGAR
jgi:hypothetical protein